MPADETGRGRAASSVTKVRLRWLATVVAIMALLTAGWPLLNSAVANRQPLAHGARVTVGTGPTSSGTVTVGSGWYVQPAQSNPEVEYVLRNGALELDIRPVALVSRGQRAPMWRGMGQVLSLTEPGSSLGRPVRTTTVHGLPAITGTVSGPRLTGMATIVPGPSREFGIAMVVLAPRGTSLELRAAARQVVLSLMFAEPSR